MPPLKLPLFIELQPFHARWDRLGLTDKDLQTLQAGIMARPEAAVVIPGTGGLRKLRCARPGEGKRGGVRVLYAHYPAYNTIILVSIYTKAENADLSPADRARYRALLPDLGRLLQVRPPDA